MTRIRGLLGRSIAARARLGTTLCSSSRRIFQPVFRSWKEEEEEGLNRDSPERGAHGVVLGS